MENLTPPINAKNQYTVAEKKEILATAEKIGVKQAAEQYQVSMNSIYNWSRAYQQHGDAGLEDHRCHNQGGKPIPDWKRQKVLAVKETDPGYGPSQIRNQLRREGVTISIESIRQILEFSDVEDEIRTMCEQSSIPKALVDIAVSDKDRLDELESQAEAG